MPRRSLQALLLVSTLVLYACGELPEHFERVDQLEAGEQDAIEGETPAPAVEPDLGRAIDESDVPAELPDQSADASPTLDSDSDTESTRGLGSGVPPVAIPQPEPEPEPEPEPLALPVFDKLERAMVRPGELLERVITARLETGDVAALVADALPPGARLEDNGDGSRALRWTPGESAIGEWTVTLTAYYPEHRDVRTSMNWVVVVAGEPGEAPKFRGTRNPLIERDKTFRYVQRAIDKDSPPPIIEIRERPEGLNVVESVLGRIELEWTPTSCHTGVRPADARERDEDELASAQARALPTRSETCWSAQTHGSGLRSDRWWNAPRSRRTRLGAWRSSLRRSRDAPVRDRSTSWTFGATDPVVEMLGKARGGT